MDQQGLLTLSFRQCDKLAALAGGIRHRSGELEGFV